MVCCCYESDWQVYPYSLNDNVGYIFDYVETFNCQK